MSIPFTQYLLPDGISKEVTIDRPAEIEALAHEFIKRGGKFDAEMLRTGEVSFTAEMPAWDEDLVAIEVCPNGPPVPATVDALVRKAHQRLGESA